MELEDYKKLKIGDEVFVYTVVSLKTGTVIGFMDGVSSAYVDTKEKAGGKKAYAWFNLYLKNKKQLSKLYNEICDDLYVLEDYKKQIANIL